MVIDLVYLWVDNSDPIYQEKNKDFINRQTKNISTYRNNEELKFSLRSIYKFIPWINNIFIITDGQKPKWLNINHPQIHVIDQKDILPQTVTHCFNSCAIEACLPNIPNLSNCFLYANDDMFINKPLNQNYFFNELNQPIFKNIRLPYFSKNLHNLCIHNANVAVFNKYSKFFFWVQSHNITPYTKREYDEIVNTSAFSQNFEATKKTMWRSVYDVSRFLIHNQMVKDKKAVFKKVHFKQELYCYARNLFLIKLLHPSVFCVNDTSWIKQRHHKKLKKWLEKKFPLKSPWEI